MKKVDLRKTIIGLGWLGLCLFALPGWGAPALRAYLDREVIFAGETATLTVELASEQTPNIRPDLGPLKTDFQVLEQRASTELQVINGRQGAKTRWQIELMPKREGSFRIPPLRVGSQLTTPVQLRVLEQRSGNDGEAAQDIFLEVEAEPKAPYVQSQVRYTARLFYALRLLEGNLDPPSSPDLVIEPIGDDVSYTAVRHGRRYQVFERRYAVFPEKSGELVLPGAVFSGRVASSDSGRSLTERFFYRGQPLRLIGDTVTLDVRPRPASFQGDHWLPAEAVTLRESWPEDPPPLQPGVPVTRTLILEAKGLGGTQLPALPVPEVPQLRVYPDQPTIATQAERSGLVGRLEQRLALIPSEAGQFILPEIQVSWWDTQADTQRVALLPARTVTVLPAAGAAVPGASAPEPVPVTPAASEAAVAGPMVGVWHWISAALFALWLATLVGWWRERRKPVPRAETLSEPTSLTSARRALRRACADHDPRRAAQALLDWAAIIWPENPPRSLGALAGRLQGDAAPVRELDRILYAPNAQAWQGGTALWDWVRQNQPRRKVTGDDAQAGLPPLYPRRA